MFSFAHPYYFLLFLPLLVAVWAVYARRARLGLLFAPMRHLPRPRFAWRLTLRLILPGLYLAGLLCLITALARPRTTLSSMTQNTSAIAIQMVVDISGSMQALDFSTRSQYRSRLDAVKEVFAEFIERRPDDLIGLVTFGGFAVCRVPLTIDHDMLQHTLKGVQIPEPKINRQGKVDNQEELLTAIGDALATASARLDQSDIKSRIIVLLSDGESNTGLIKPEDAIKAAKALGVKVYTIGMGSDGRAPFEARDVFGNRHITYEYVSMDENLLKKIANDTGGLYFNARDPKGLDRAMKEIDKLEKTEVRKIIQTRYHEFFVWPLLAGLALCLLGAGGHMALSRALI